MFESAVVDPEWDVDGHAPDDGFDDIGYDDAVERMLAADSGWALALSLIHI